MTRRKELPAVARLVNCHASLLEWRYQANSLIELT